VQNPYTEGLLPGFEIRLHGLGAHANILSAILLSYLVLSWFSPTRFRWERLHQVVALSALILTQSKTAWIILMIAYLLRLAYARQRYARLALLGAALSIGAFYLALGPDWLDTAGGFWQNNQVTTLTGRTRVWQITLDLWEQNPWFGYGPDLWAGEMRTAYRALAGFAVPHAHSQFYQSLGEAGIVGVAGLFLYVMILLVYGVRYAGATAGIALILVLALLIRGVTEPPFRTILTDGNLFVHFLTFAFLILACRRKKEQDEA
jgi:exopolysaccharide production protein ExoQ